MLLRQFIPCSVFHYPRSISNIDHRFYSQQNEQDKRVKNSVLDILNIQPPNDGEPTDQPKQSIRAKGWIQTVRNSKYCSFIELNDGSNHQNLQVVIDNEYLSKEQTLDLQTGASIDVEGDLVFHFNKKAKKHLPEIHCKDLKVIGKSDESYPLQKKFHSREFLRENLHLRPRTRRFGSTMRVRSHASMELSKYLQNRGIYQIHTPIITSSDCEGSGDLFEISQSSTKDKKYAFFNKPAFLGVSGQLHAEAFACGLSNVYTFGPTFRAELSHTQQHLSEFWMLEPELVHADLSDIVDLTKDMIVETVKALTENPIVSSELEFLYESAISQHEKQQKESIQSYADTLSFSDKTLSILKDSNAYHVITYDEGISLLSKHTSKLSTPVDWKEGFTREHELYLVHKIFNGHPVFVLHYPTVQKAFYMKKTPNSNGEKVACMDLLFPLVGEVAGGSEREDSYDILKQTMNEKNIGKNGEYDWYLDLRKFGSVPHAGFGLGFERFLQVLTCTRNIRDVIPMPRSYQNCQL